MIDARRGLVGSRRGFLVSGGAALLAPPLAAIARAARPVATTLHAQGPGVGLDHYWSRCVGAGRAAEGLRAAWLEQLALVHDVCGFSYCRFHGLFHDEMFILREKDGAPVHNWQYVDELFDRMLEIGVRPFVELGFMPAALASGTATQFWWKGNVTPPADFEKWGDLVTACARHWLERYGIDEVANWYFEVWNEPDLNGFWRGTRSQYFELYKTSARALKAVDPRLSVGGPATSNFVGDERFDGEIEDKTKDKTNIVDDLDALPWHGVWVEAFLAYCAQERLPVDFVSCHPYPTDFALDPSTARNKGQVRSIDATRLDLAWLRRTVGRSAFPKAQIHLTEWSSSPSSRDATHDYLQAAAFILKTNLDSIGLVDSLSYWTFTDVFEEGGAGPTAFHGGFGLVNYQGIVKPSFHAYRMLNALGDELLSRADGLVVTRHSRDGRISALAYNFPVEVKTSLSFGNEASADTIYAAGSARAFSLSLSGLTRNTPFQIEQIDKMHCNPHAAWKAMGAPPSPTREQIRMLKTLALQPARSSAAIGADRHLRWSATLAPWTCVFLTQT